MAGRGPLHLASWHSPVTTQPCCLLGQLATGAPSKEPAHAPLQLEPIAMSLQVDGQVFCGKAGGAPSHTAVPATGRKATWERVSSRISQGTSMQAHAAAKQAAFGRARSTSTSVCHSLAFTLVADPPARGSACCCGCCWHACGLTECCSVAS